MPRLAERLKALEYNVFADMDRFKAQARAQGRDLIDLAVGSSDLPIDPAILQTIAESLPDPSTHGYLLFSGSRPFRQKAAHWAEVRFGIRVDPETEVLPLIGSQEGTAHLPLVVLNPGDYALLQDPGYPSHLGGIHLASGRIHTMPLRANNRFLPIFAEIPLEILAQSKLMVLSYPHNPTTATASLEFFEEALAFCQQHDLTLAHDFPYVDLVFEGPEAPSILQADRFKERSIEFFSLSKSYHMGGFRIGFAIGNADLIRGLAQLKSVIDFNQYLGILRGAIKALDSPPAHIQKTQETIRTRRDALVKALNAIGWKVPSPRATMYVWCALPEPWVQDSIQFCRELLLATGVALAPGVGFGLAGEGYVRFALVRSPEILQEAVARLAQFISN